MTIHTARPRRDGKKGEDVENCAKAVAAIAGVPAQINIASPQAGADGKLVADSITSWNVAVMFRRAMKRAAERHASKAKGIKAEVPVVWAALEIARTEWYREGRVPLHTLRADIDYAHFGSPHHLRCNWR